MHQESSLIGIYMPAEIAVDCSNFLAVVSDDEMITFAELHILVKKMVMALDQTNIERARVVGLHFQSPLKHLVVSLALLKMRVTQVSINPKDNAATQLKVFLLTEVEVIVGDSTGKTPDSQCFILVKDDFEVITTGLSPNRGKGETALDAQNKPAMIFLGSGTTGVPKILAPHFSLLSHLIARDLMVRSMRQGERHYCPSSLDYYTAKRRTLGCLAQGITVLLPRSPPANLVTFCQNNSIDHLSLTTTQALRLLEQEKDLTDSPGQRLPTLRSLFVGSSPVSEVTRQRLRHKISKRLFVVYGSNEFGEATVATPEDQDNHPGTVGRPCPGVTVQVLDERAKLCPPGVKGAIRLHSEQMMKSYHNDVAASKQSFTEQGYYPGDVGSLLADGNLVFSGRLDDMMIFQGVNIYPREIEQLLESHPMVLEAAAFPMLIQGNDSAPFAVVCVLGQVSEAELLKLCFAELGWRRPQRIFFTQEMPRNAGGKILKRELATKVAAMLGATKGRTQAQRGVISIEE